MNEWVAQRGKFTPFLDDVFYKVTLVSAETPYCHVLFTKYVDSYYSKLGLWVDQQLVHSSLYHMTYLFLEFKFIKISLNSWSFSIFWSLKYFKKFRFTIHICSSCPCQCFVWKICLNLHTISVSNICSNIAFFQEIQNISNVVSVSIYTKLT